MGHMVSGRECRGRYYSKGWNGEMGGYREFDRGTFLGFGIDYKEFESGPAQYTTAIVELRTGQVVTTPPEFIQFINAKRAKEKLDAQGSKKGESMANETESGEWH